MFILLALMLCSCCGANTSGISISISHLVCTVKESWYQEINIVNTASVYALMLMFWFSHFAYVYACASVLVKTGLKC